MKLLQSQLVLSNHARICYSLTLSEGSYEDLFKPETWAHIATKCPKGTLIEAQPEDGSWFAMLIVRASTDLEVTVAELFKRDLTTEQPKREESEYEIKWAGPQAKFRIIRRSDKVVLKDGFQTKELAADWLKTPDLAKAA